MARNVPRSTKLPAINCQVLYPDIHDLPGLAALLHGYVPGNPAMVDLQGRTLSGTLDGLSVLRIETPGLILRHGTLCLPPQVALVVLAEGIKLCDVIIVRTPTEKALPAISIQAKNSQLELCRLPGVYVAAASSASLRWCILSGSPGDGLYVNGPGSHVEVHDCDSHSNVASGFASSGAGAVMRLSGRCKATNNGSAGFISWDRGSITCSDACVAAGNAFGFVAMNVGSQLMADHGCRAERNSDIGFHSVNGGQLSVGDKCEAYNNGKQGFDSTGKGTKLWLGRGCRTVANGTMGISARCGGLAFTDQGCISMNNRGTGFSSVGEGSYLTVGASSRAVHNKVNCQASKGGVLLIGTGCQLVPKPRNDRVA